MPRTTLHIDRPVLEELKRRGKEEGLSLGRLTSDLLAQALATRGEGSREPSKFHWRSQAMGSRFDLADKEALARALDGEVSTSPS